MAELLKFYPEGDLLYIEFLCDKYIQNQPKSPEETKALFDRLTPIIQRIDEYVDQNNLKEVIELNLKNVPISKLNPATACELVNMCTRLREDKKAITKITITNSNPLFTIIYETAKGMLPPHVVRILSIEESI